MVIPFNVIDKVIAAVEHIKVLERELDEQVANGLVVPDDIRELMKSDKIKRV